MRDEEGRFLTTDFTDYTDFEEGFWGPAGGRLGSVWTFYSNTAFTALKVLLVFAAKPLGAQILTPEAVRPAP